MSETNGAGTLLNKDQITERNAKIMRGWMHRWVRNSAQTYVKELLDDNHNLSHLAGKHAGQPALVTGSGPSLEQSLEIIGGDFPGVVITTNSGISACLKHGLKPDYVHIFDGMYMPERLEGIPVDDMTLVGVTTLAPEVWEFWKGKGPMYAFHMYDPTSQFFQEIQWYYWTFDALPTSGSVGPNAVRLASYMGCNPIIVAGMDLGFTGGKYRVDQYQLKRGKWKVKPFDHQGAINRQPISYEKGCPCWRITGLLYKTALTSIVKQFEKEGLAFMRIVPQDKTSHELKPMVFPETKGIDVFNATIGGIWENEIPRLDLAKWLEERKAA